MTTPLQPITDILSRTPDALRALLGGMPEPRISTNYGPGTFSPRDVVGHLIEGERSDWIPRARMILAGRAEEPFPPFDHRATGGVSPGVTINDLLNDFERLRRENLDALASFGLSDRRLGMPGTHPEFGRVTLGQLLATWAAHDLHHIAQVCKCLARHHSDDVGPWRAYLGILTR